MGDNVLKGFVKFTKEEIMKMCSKYVVDINMPRRDDEKKLMGSPIINLEFEKDTLDLHIIIKGESIQLRMEK